MNSIFHINPAIMDLIFLGNVSPAIYGVLAGVVILFYAVYFKRIFLFLEKNIMNLAAAVILTLTYFVGPVFGIIFITFLKFIECVMENPREYPRVYSFIDKVF